MYSIIEKFPPLMYHIKKFKICDEQMKKFLRNSKNIPKIVVIITALVSIIGTVFSSFVLDAVISSHDEERMKFIAADVYDDINAELLKLVMIARVISNDIPLIESMQMENENPFELNVYRMSNYLSKLKNSFRLSTTFVVSDESKIYYSAEGFNKIIDVDNDRHDIWYKLFLDKNLAYGYDIDVDEINENIWTIFVSARINDAEGNLLGVCGVGEYLTEIQNLLITDEQTYNVKITLVNQEGVIQLDSNYLSIEQAHIQNVVNPNKSTQFVLTENDGVYTITKYMPDLGLYLVVRRDIENNQGVYSNLIFYMAVSFIIASAIFLIFMRMALKLDHEQVEDTAKKQGMASYADLYISMHLIDLKENSIHEISNNPKYKLISIEGEQDAALQIENSVREITAIENLKDMLKFVSLDTIAARLEKNRVINQEFLTHDYGWCKAYFIVIEYDSMHEIREIIFAIELIDEEKNRENELLYLSQTDLMTGLKNRGSGEKSVQDLINSGVEGMFCLLDADKFKSINDNYGHDVGDKVIKAIADCLKKTFRNTDITMRLGGDEFAVYVVGVVSEVQGEIFIENFLEEIESIKIPELGDRKITVSLGATFFNVDEKLSFVEVYKRADSAAYASKKVPGNVYRFYKE